MTRTQNQKKDGWSQISAPDWIYVEVGARMVPQVWEAFLNHWMRGKGGVSYAEVHIEHPSTVTSDEHFQIAQEYRACYLVGPEM